MPESVYFISSLLIVGAGIFRFNKKAISTSISIIFAAVCYSVFCFVAFGKVKGFIPTENIASLISQQGYDPSRLPLPISQLTRLGFICGIAFNLFTALWLVLKGKFGNYCLISALLFCIVGIVMGAYIRLNPIYSLFGLCCGFMAAVGWVLGLSYVEFCVIGNIYITAFTIMIAASCVIISSAKKQIRLNWLLIIYGAVQIMGAFALLCHYHGGFNHAFYQCVYDLKAMAKYFGTTYEAMNIYIYVCIIPLILATDIILWRMTKNYPK